MIRHTPEHVLAGDLAAPHFHRLPPELGHSRPQVEPDVQVEIACQSEGRLHLHQRSAMSDSPLSAPLTSQSIAQPFPRQFAVHHAQNSARSRE